MTLDAFLRLAVDDILGTYKIYGQGVEYARDTAPFALYYRAAVEFLLNYGALSDDPAERYAMWYGSLDMMLTDAWVVERVGYAAFEVTIPAGESVTVTAQLTKEHSYNFWGSGYGRENVDGYDFLTGAASKLLFTEETASFRSCFTPMRTLPYPVKHCLSFGYILSPVKSSAQHHSTSELLRTLLMSGCF